MNIIETQYNSYGTLMKIIDYISSNNIIIEFQDDYKYITRTTYASFISGKVRNPYDKSAYNVGFVGVGCYSIRNNQRAYQTWRDMLKRCYDPYNMNTSNHSCYQNCIVCEDWFNFQNFAKWYEDNYYVVENEIMCLDKDILFKQNNIYSPNTCLIVPATINKLFVKQKKSNSNLPIGCYNHDGKIMVTCRLGKNRVYKSGFNYNQVEEAFEYYKNLKEEYIRKVANDYKDRIPDKVYTALINYSIEIND